MSKLITQYNANENEAHITLLGRNLFLKLDYATVCKITEFIKDIEVEIRIRERSEISDELFNMSERYAK